MIQVRSVQYIMEDDCYKWGMPKPTLTIRALGGILLGMRATWLCAGLLACASPTLRAEEAAARAPALERHPWEVSLQARGGAPISVDRGVLQRPDAEAFSGLVGQLREQGVSGLPEGQDAFARQLFQSPVFMNGDKTFVVQNGKFLGISIAHDGKTYFFKPGQTFAVEAGGQTALVSQPGGGVASKPVASLDLNARRAVQAGLAPLAAFRGPDGGLRFDGARDGAPVQARRPAQSPAPQGSTPDFKPVPRPADGRLVLANDYKGPIPKELKAGQFYWDAKELKVVESSDGAAVKSRTVGYMADMQDAKGGEMVFWHGGAEPDKKGAHPHAAKNWSLWYMPKVDTDQYHVEGGKNTAKFVSNYNMVDVSGAAVIKTDAGPRLQLWTAMKTLPVYKRMPPAQMPKDAAAALEAAPSDRALFRYGAPVGNKTHPLQSYVDMEGGLYQEQERAGKKYIVRAGQLFNIKPIAAPSERPAASQPPALLAPAPAPDKVVLKTDPLADLMGVLRSDLRGAQRTRALEAAYKGVSAGDYEVYKAARQALGAYATGTGLSSSGRIEAAQAMLRLFPQDRAASLDVVNALRQVIVPKEVSTPDYLGKAAKRFDDEGFSPALAAELTAYRAQLASNPSGFAALRLIPPTPYQNPDPSTAEALKLLSGLTFKDSNGGLNSDAVVARTQALQGALLHPDPSVRLAAAAALGELGEYSRKARHMLAATSVLDFNPAVRVAAAAALPKVDSSGHYEALAPSPAPTLPDQKPVYGPAPAMPAAPKASRLSGVLAMRPSDARAEGVTANMQYLMSLARDFPGSEELASARADLRRLTSDEKGALAARGEAASLLMLLPEGGSDRAALRTLVRITGPDAESRAIDPAMRAGAIRSLGLASDPKEFDVGSRLTHISTDKAEDVQVRFAAFYALYYQASPSGRQKFADDFFAANPDLRALVQQQPSRMSAPLSPFASRQDPFSQFTPRR